MERMRVWSGAPWEKTVGYCRAVRAGNVVAVSGTAPVNPDGTTHAPGDGYRQARRCLAIIEAALGQVGAKMSDVIRTRMYVTDMARFGEYARAHGEVFGDVPPATSCVEVKGLVSPDMLIEIEADAVIA